MGRKQFRWLTGLIGMFIILFSSGSLNAQAYESLLKSDSIFNDTIDHLIISEWRGDSWATAYIELTNMGDTAIDLRKMAVRSLPGGKDHWTFDYTEGSSNETMAIMFDSLQMSVEDYTLEPGEIFLMAPHYDEVREDGDPIHRPELIAMADYIGYKKETKIENDTFNYGERFFRQWGGYPVGVFVAVRVADTAPPFYKQEWVLVDNVNGDRDPVSGEIGLGFTSVAGFPEATNEAVLVRKHTVTKGTREGEWTAAAGDDISNSEWIPIKHDDNNPGGKVFKTAGNHGNFAMDVTGGNGTVVDLNNGTLEVPWGALRGEDIIDNEVILGPGMAWTYQNYSEEGDSLLDINDWSYNKIAMPGDVITVYACGDDLDKTELTIQYLTHGEDIVKVYPRNRLNEDGLWVSFYYVTDDEPTIDTIGNVPFATRIDSLIKYVDIAPNSTWEIIYVDGESRIDLKYGDILQITGADGSTQKQYFIDVLDYVGSPESRLISITWPDIYLQSANIPYYLQNGWASGSELSDTLPGFSSSKLTYMIKVAPGTIDVPALVATPMNLNATIEIDRAVDLNGSVEDRTTTITVTSEDTTSVSVYSILFEVYSDEFQQFAADPIISTAMFTVNTRNAAIELYNPGNVELDLSKYLLVRTKGHNDWVQAIQDTMDFFFRYAKYVPGYVYKAIDTTTWNQTQDYTLQKGADIGEKLAPGDVFVMANMHNKQGKWWVSDNHAREIDVLFHPKEALVSPYYPDASIYRPEELDIVGAPKGQPSDQQGHVGYMRADHSFFLFKIDNDSILAGTKAIYDTADFTLVDALGDPINSPGYSLASWDENGDSARVWSMASGGGGLVFIREPHVHKGVSTIGEGISEDHEVCQWIVGDELYWPEVEGRWTGMTQHFGSHSIDVVAIYVSTITSSVYIVSTGFEGIQSVKGVVDGTTVEQFIANITKADPDQTLQFLATADGSELGLTDVLSDSDTLVVAAADSSNFTTYVLEVTTGGLKSDATLESSVYTVDESGAEGTISDIPVGTSVKDVFDNVTPDADARINIIDANGELVSLNTRDIEGNVVLRTANSDVYFEVIAQDKVTKIVYQLVPAVAATDAYLISDVYTVADNVVDGLTFGVSVEAFYNNIIVVGGESYIEDIAGYKREIGTLNYDDSVVVVSEDKSVTVKYGLGFISVEQAPENQAPVIDLVGSANAVENITFNLTATVTDDGLPEGVALTYTWSVKTGNSDNVTFATPDAPATDVTISIAGDYVLELLVSDSELESTAEVNVTVADDGTGFTNRTKATLNVYPNPTVDKVFVEGLTINSKVVVYNMNGAIVDEFHANDGRQFVELGGQPSGNYIINVIENNGSVRIGRVIKK